MAQEGCSNGDDGTAEGPGGDDLILHVRGSSDYQPMELNASEPVEFTLDNFSGRCLFMHRPSWSYDNRETAEGYPYKQHFHGRKRLWEWRLQGRFVQRPTTLYSGIELEEYVAVNFATRALMRGILPLVQRSLQCKLVHHEIGRPGDLQVRPVVVAPVWAADNTLVHTDPADVPDLAAPTLPKGFDRKAARSFWENVWAGGGPSWDAPAGGPTITIAIWGPSQLMDLRAWVFRRLPMTWGRDIKMEPFCGRQPVHAVVYELQGGQTASEHRQADKMYAADIRMMPQALWSSRPVGRPSHLDTSDTQGVSPTREDTESFCSALSHSSCEDNSVHDVSDLLLERTNSLPVPLVGSSSSRSSSSTFNCCRRRRRRAPYELQQDSVV
mmetsp:Transcript_68894/g.149934  ORF Transcript_68894/g.149934 Transcript_68894/m.149934 type:complete len:383 (-) Transcript_68894:19-1167(-)